jgi:hypothetical protein
MEAKRKNKLLKTAIQRMATAGIGGMCPRCAAEKPPKQLVQDELDKNPFFITENNSSHNGPIISEPPLINHQKKKRNNNRLYQS